MNSAPTINSYDQVPYPSHPFAASHPDRLATIGTLFGMSPRSVDDCRVLELGCASGGNIIPMAVSVPGSEFQGIDLSRQQILTGQKVVADLGLRNLRLEVQDCMDFDPGAEKFDYIICHGVFSWVPQEVQERILALSVQALNPQGIVYISYNTRPGWNMRETIRDMMQYHVANLEEPQARVGQARAILEFLASSVPADGNAYGMLLKSELAQLQKQSDGYLLHEHLEVVNEPIYFHEFMTRARSAGLDYVGEADLGVMWLGNVAPKTAEVLRGAASNVIKMEQYMDFLRNRMFRRTLLCHSGVKIHRNMSVRSLEGRFLSANLTLLDSPADLKSSAVARFQNGRQQIVSTSAPVSKIALQILGSSWPLAVRFEELANQAISAVNPNNALPGPPAASELTTLGNDLLTLCASDQVEISIAPSRFTTRVSDLPTASPLARYQAQSGSTVTNLRHELIRLDGVDQQLLQRLDGHHQRGQLVDFVEELAATGKLSVNQRQTEDPSGPSLRRSLQQAVDVALQRMARLALLVQQSPP